jgi:hypothetical protein
MLQDQRTRPSGTIILGLLRSDDSKYVWFRKVRGAFLRRPRTGPPKIVASGSDAWIGWLELKTAPVRAGAMKNTARVIHEVGAEILASSRRNRDLLSPGLLPR